jgi:hypothetical protein
VTHLIVYYGIFVIGYILHAGLQIDAIVRSDGNGACSRMQAISQNGIVLAARFFLSILVLAVLKTHPEYLGAILGFAGISMSNVVIVTSSWVFAGGWGFTVDTFMTFIPVFKNFVPPLNPVKAKVSVSLVEQKGTAPKTITTVETTATIPAADETKKP